MAVLKISRLWPAAKRRLEPSYREPVGLDAFTPESGAAAVPAASHPATKAVSSIPLLIGPPLRRFRVPLSVALILAAIATGVYAFNKLIPWRAATGSITFETAPAGMEVAIAGKSVGRTPVTVSLPAGSYEVRLGTGAGAHAFTVPVTSGESMVQHFEMAPAPVAPAAATGSLRIQTDPARRPIQLDGVDRGLSPLALDGVSAGDHEIAIRGDQGLVKRIVHVSAGQSTSVIVASAQPKADAPVVTAGWLSVASPIALQVREGGRLVGSSDVDKLMMASGDHAIELTNESLGFRTQRTIKIGAGKTTATRVDVPSGTMSLNALPWADVYVDGERIGQTPIGNLSRPIGRHEVIFRHPTFGERKEYVTVTTRQTARLGVDLRK